MESFLSNVLDRASRAILEKQFEVKKHSKRYFNIFFFLNYLYASGPTVVMVNGPTMGIFSKTIVSRVAWLNSIGRIEHLSRSIPNTILTHKLLGTCMNVYGH